MKLTSLRIPKNVCTGNSLLVCQKGDEREVCSNILIQQQATSISDYLPFLNNLIFKKEAFVPEDGRVPKESRSINCPRLERQIEREVDCNLVYNPFLSFEEKCNNRVSVNTGRLKVENLPPGKDNIHCLVVKIGNIDIVNHPLFLEEERLTSKISELIESLRNFEMKNETEYLIEKSIAISRRLEELLKGSIKGKRMSRQNTVDSSSLTSIKYLYKDLVSNISKVKSIEKTFHNTFCSILKTWKKVIDIRSRQGFDATIFSLQKVESEPLDVWNDVGEKSNCLLKSLMTIVNLFGQNDDEWSEGTIDKLESLEQELALMDSNRSSRCTLRFVQDEALSQVSIENKEEDRRRKDIAKESYIVKLLVDGEVVNTSSHSSICMPQWKSKFQHHISCYLKTFSKVSVEIHRFKGLLGGGFVAEMPLVIPCQSVHPEALGLSTPMNEKYFFKSSNIKENLCGSICIETSWSSSSIIDTTQEPIVPSTDSQTIRIGTQSMYDTAANTSNENVSASIIVSSMSMDFGIAGSKNMYRNHDRFVEGIRHNLIRQRERMSVKTAKIPLVESDIPDGTVKSILADRKLKYRYDDDLIEKACKERPLSSSSQVAKYVLLLRRVQQLQTKMKTKRDMKFDSFVFDQSRIDAEKQKNQDFLFHLTQMIPQKKRLLLPSSNYDSCTSHKMASLDKKFFTLTVVEASNLPRKKDETLDSTDLMSPPAVRRLKSGLDFAPAIKNTFQRPNLGMKEEVSKGIIVQVKFDGKYYTTKSGYGINSLWQQAIVIPYPDTFEGLPITSDHTNKLSLDVSLFDLVEVDVGVANGGYLDDECTTFTEKRFLASTSIPLLHSKRLQQRFCLEIPDVLFGYSRDCGRGIVQRGDEEMQLNQSRNEKKKMAKVSLHINTGPSCHQIDDIEKINARIPLTREGGKVRKWQSKFLSLFENRIHQLFYYNSDGDIVLIKKLLQNQEPPPEFRGSRHQCAYFVSLFPSLEKWNAFANEEGVELCLSSQQCLELGATNSISRAVILANYFMYISRQSNEEYNVYLVFGRSLTEGNTVLVMTKSMQSEAQFWSPSTGRCFSPTTKFSFQIHVVVSTNNVFGNVQATTNPWRVDFNFQNTKKWLPLDRLDSQEGTTPSPLQETYLQYREPDEVAAMAIETEITDALKTSIRNLRRMTTIFNYDIPKRLGTELEELEYIHRHGFAIPSTSDYNQIIESICTGKSIFGFSLHFSYTSVENIISEIEATYIYETLHPLVEFSLTVRVFPYANNLYSVRLILLRLAPIPK